MIEKNETQPGQTAGLAESSLLGSLDSRENAKKSGLAQGEISRKCERRHLRLVDRQPERRLQVRIGAFAGRDPYGHSRSFDLADRDFEQLLDHAERLDRKGRQQ